MEKKLFMIFHSNGKLYLAVSHMTVQNLGQDPVTNYLIKLSLQALKIHS